MDNTTMQASHTERNLHKILTGLLLFTVLIVYVPFNPLMPGFTLDASWQFAMNEATASRLVIGKDIIFTFGPYSSVFSRLYHPSTDYLMLFGGFVLALFSGTLLYYLTRTRSVIWLFLFTGFLAAGVNSPDVQLFLYPLLVALYIYRIFTDKSNTAGVSNSQKLFCALLFIPFGLLFLIKSSLIILIVGITGLSTIFFWYKGMKKTAISICVVPLLSLVFFQLVAHQPIAGLWYFFKNSFPIISGYSEAMSTHGDKKEILCFLLSSLLLVIICYRNMTVPREYRLFLIFSISLFLFSAFKLGFTRHDGHAMAAASGILLLAFLMYTIIRRRSLHVLFALSAFTWIFIFHTYNEPGNIIKPMLPVYSQALDGILLRTKDGSTLKNRFEQALNNIRQQPFKIPALKGTTDLYSYEQGYLLASNNNWSPRPVIQSYSAYNTRLAEINEAHLTGPKAPNNLVFGITPIDNRLPALEDGLSWPTIINNYQPLHTDGSYLFLQEKRAAHTTPKRKELYTLKGIVGEEVVLPDTTQVLFAQFDIRKTLMGSLSATLYKPDPMAIFITFVDGTQVHYPFIVAMAKPGFILSPLVNNISEFSALYQNGDILKNKYIRSFRIANDGMGLSRFISTWKREYTIHLSQIQYDR